jgi:hypothetical protein
MFEDKIKPQGHAKDTVAHNANLEPFDIAGVDALTMVQANTNKIDEINDNDGGILSIATIPENNNPNPLILPNTSDSDMLDDEDKYEDKETNDDDSSNTNLLQGDGQEADTTEERLTDNQDQGVCRSKRNNKGATAKFADYSLMMNARQTKGGQSQATIRNGLMFSRQKT